MKTNTTNGRSLFFIAMAGVLKNTYDIHEDWDAGLWATTLDTVLSEYSLDEIAEAICLCIKEFTDPPVPAEIIAKINGETSDNEYARFMKELADL